jgi:hypothetical protein
MITKVIRIEPVKQRVKFELSQTQKVIIMPVGDVHWGSKQFPTKHFVEYLRWGYDRGAYFIGMGDYLDFTSESQRNTMTVLRDSTKERLDDMVRFEADTFLKTISFTYGRWLGLLKGNHSWTFAGGNNVEQHLCKDLGCDYLGDMTILRIVTTPPNLHEHPEADTILVAHHGRGGGITIGGQLSKPEHLLKWISADVLLMGHSHAKLAAPIDRLNLTPDGVLSHRTTVVARTGSFLRAYAGQEPKDLDSAAFLSEGSYVEKAALMPSALGGICFSIGYEKIGGSSYYKPTLHFSI